MDIVLKIMGGALGILVPFLFALTFYKGIQNSPFEETKKKTLKRNVTIVIFLWTALVWVSSLAGFISYHPGDVFPRFLIPLFVPVLFGLYLLTTKDFRTILDYTPLSFIVGVQTFRLAGFAFLIVANMAILPKIFETGGYGDIVTGILALLASLTLWKKLSSGKVFFWAFNAAGLIDLLNVAFLLLLYYPIWNTSQPSSAAAADFALVMIPALAAPIALLLHAYSVRNFLLKKM